MNMKLWLARLVASFIQGASHGGAATLGLMAAHQYSDKIPTLNWYGFGVVVLTSGLLKLLGFLDVSMSWFLKTNELPTKETDEMSKT